MKRWPRKSRRPKLLIIILVLVFAGYGAWFGLKRVHLQRPTADTTNNKLQFDAAVLPEEQSLIAADIQAAGVTLSGNVTVKISSGMEVPSGAIPLAGYAVVASPYSVTSNITSSEIKTSSIFVSASMPVAVRSWIAKTLSIDIASLKESTDLPKTLLDRPEAIGRKR